MDCIIFKIVKITLEKPRSTLLLDFLKKNIQTKLTVEKIQAIRKNI